MGRKCAPDMFHQTGFAFASVDETVNNGSMAQWQLCHGQQTKRDHVGVSQMSRVCSSI